MARHEALVSGSFALQFLDRVLWKDSDLDLYADYPLHGVERATDALGQYLKKVEGYVLQAATFSTEHEYVARMKKVVLVWNPDTTPLYWESQSCTQISTYTKQNDDGDELKIQTVST
jgi:hypothetical protein